jgi:hypothetical protein
MLLGESSTAGALPTNLPSNMFITAIERVQANWSVVKLPSTSVRSPPKEHWAQRTQTTKFKL